VDLDSTGDRQAGMDIAQIGQPSAAVTDAQGNLIIVGSTASPGPLLHGRTLWSKPARDFGIRCL
jgi:hypothetical protein